MRIFHNLFSSPNPPLQFISVPYLTTPLKISNLAFFAFLKRIFPPTIVLWLEMLTMLSSTRFYQTYLVKALEIFLNKNNMIWHTHTYTKLKQGLSKSFILWTEERYFFKKRLLTFVSHVISFHSEAISHSEARFPGTSLSANHSSTWFLIYFVHCADWNNPLCLKSSTSFVINWKLITVFSKTLDSFIRS